MADPLGVEALRLLLTHPDADCGPLLAHLTEDNLHALIIAGHRLADAGNDESHRRLRQRAVIPDPEFADEWEDLERLDAFLENPTVSDLSAADLPVGSVLALDDVTYTKEAFDFLEQWSGSDGLAYTDIDMQDALNRGARLVTTDKKGNHG